MLQTKSFRSNNKGEQNVGYLYLPKSSGSHEVIEIDEYLTMGRDANCLLEIEDPYISSRHARIERTPKGFVLRDMRSRNGTYVNGAKVGEAFLADRDMITMGDTQIQFRFQTEDDDQDTFLKSLNSSWQSQLMKFPSVAQSEMPVLILGESGTGKELIARTIHRLSSRKHAPLVSVNCSALGDSLVESELFGHRKGSFTDATHDRKGAFESARGGTLFLDEIGDLPLNLQPKLLRALENQEIRPVGSDSAVKTDVRIVAATHQNLQQKVAEGDFREDLYFRLNVVKITPPPLRHRVEDF
ncbi:MAG: sigma-54-dependent Fis family transcriptional regulator [Pseudomonadota bacterium]